MYRWLSRLERDRSMAQTKRNIKSQKNRNKLLAAAKDLVDERGYDNVTIDDICAACGLTKGAFYYHFKSKNDVVFQFERSRFIDLVDDIAASDVENPIDQLCLYVVRWHRFLDSDSLNFSREWTRQHTDPEKRHEIYGDKGSSLALDMKAIRNYLEEGINAKVLTPDTPTEQISRMITYCMYGILVEKVFSDESAPTITWGLSFSEYIRKQLLAPYFVDSIQ